MKPQKFIKMLLKHYENRLDKLKAEMSKQLNEIEELREAARAFTTLQLQSTQEHQELERAYRKVQKANMDRLQGEPDPPSTTGNWSIDEIRKREG